MKQFLVILLGLLTFLISSCSSPEAPQLSQLASRVYVANEESGTISVLDGKDASLIKTINLNSTDEHNHGGSGDGMYMLHNVQVAPNGHTVWVTAKPMEDSLPEEVVVIDAHDLMIRTRIVLRPELHVAHVVVDTRSEYAYVSANESDKVLQLEVNSGSLVREYDLPTGSKPHGMRYSQGRLYIANMGSKALGILDIVSGNYNSVSLGGVAVQVALPPDNSAAYVSLYDTKEVVRYDLVTGAIKRLSLPAAAQGPVQLYPTPDSKYLLVADQGMLMDRPASDWVFRVDLSANEIDRELRTGAGAHGVVVSRDGLHAYVTNSAANSVSHLKLDSWTVDKTVPVDDAPNGISYWEDMMGMP